MSSPSPLGYESAVAFVDARAGNGIRPGVDRMRSVLNAMGNPHQSFEAVHVAGTNGKTTVTWLVEAILSAHGRRAASYTSPHLEDLEDRYRIRGETISPSRFAELVSQASGDIEQWETDNDDQLTYFETTVALAMRLFAIEDVDVGVVEVGLGGRLDATNVLKARTAVITGISLDHTDLLGESLAEIAQEKAGIVHRGGRLVTGELPPEAVASIERRANATESDWYRYGADFDVRRARPTADGWRVDIQGLYDVYEDLALPMRGRHQLGHLASAIAACELSQGRALQPDRLETAFARILVPGRIETMATDPLVIVDGAHNAEGVAGLADALQEEFSQADRVLVVGLSGSRNARDVLAPLAGLASKVIVTQADGGIPAVKLANYVRSVFADTPVDVITPASVALATAIRNLPSDGMVVVTGSLYLVGEARRAVADALPDSAPGA